ncbi:MAG: hypothetical protein O2898_04920 [Proteobacteria bacterium]|nr:hypothetical protein [Pseudomonadota bacterium]
MPRKVVIHAGFHKTGSNSVQQTLRLNRPVLRRVMASVLKPMMRDVVGAARAYSVTGDPLDRARFAARMVLLLQDQPPMNRRVLCLSSEELAGHLPGRPGVQDYRAILTLSEDIVSAASSLFPQAEIVFFFLTRDPRTWIESAYWEHVKSSDMVMELEEFRHRFTAAADLDGIADAVAQATGRPVQRARLEDVAGQVFGPAEPLLDLCEVPQDLRAGLTRPAPANTRPAPDILAELLRLNREIADKEARRRAKEALLQSGGQA